MISYTKVAPARRWGVAAVTVLVGGRPPGRHTGRGAPNEVAGRRAPLVGEMADPPVTVGARAY